MAKDDKGHGSNSRGDKTIPNSPAKAQGMKALGIDRPRTPRTKEYREMTAKQRDLEKAYLGAKGKDAETAKAALQDHAGRMNQYARTRSEGPKATDAKPSPHINKRGDTFKPRRKD